jgi:L-threonylcarbamoyladenylate synthase
MNRIRLTNNNWDEAIEKAKRILNEGGIVVYPTETCYGIAVDATNQKALSKLLSYKKFRGSKPISVAVSNKDMAQKYVEINEMAENLYNNYLPGPITVVSNSKGELKAPVVSKQGTTGIRIPDYKFTLKLIEKFGRPITATSANVTYKPNPYSIDQLIKDLPQRNMKMIDLFLDAGELPKNPSSTILDTTMNTLTVLREGKLKFEDAILKSTLLEEKTTNTPEDTTQFGKQFGEEYIKGIGGPVVVALSGELGAGKTQFTKGIAQGLNIEDIINSPTYTIINEHKYEDRVFAHMDTWRLVDEDDLNRSGLIEHLDEGNIVVIEWADKFYQEIEELCRVRNIPMYKITFKYISLEEREIVIYGTN